VASRSISAAISALTGGRPVQLGLLAALSTRPLPRWAVIHWDAWTRRHQAHARWFHKLARLARDAEISLVS